jgi:tetratricopeptide (TPR) repeat protein
VPSDTFTFPPLEIKSAAPLRGRGGPEKRPGMKVEALQAAQQQAEFFASLGQHDEAIEVLGAYIEESSESAALAYLELFRMYQALDMRKESSQLETEIRRVYGIPVGALNQHLEHPRELESYPSAISRITASWPTAEGLSIIEDLLFRRPSGERELLSAEAYRELLWLYALGQEIVHRTGMPAGLQLLGDSRLPNDHFIMPWAPVEEVPLELSMETLNAIDVAQASTGFGVDVDLTDVPEDVFEQGRQHAHQRSIPVQPAPAEVIDLFDAAMESQSRKLFVHR